MFSLILDVTMLVWGIVILVKAEIRLTRRRALRGVWARIVGGLLVAAFPLGYVTRLGWRSSDYGQNGLGRRSIRFSIACFSTRVVGKRRRWSSARSS